MPLFPPIFVPAPWIIGPSEIITQGSSLTLTANLVYLYLFTTPTTIAVASMRYRMGATATGTVDLGLYDVNGNLLGHTGATATVASGLNSINLISSVTLPPGKYTMALCPSNATDTYIGASGLKAGSGNFYQATTSGTAGVLPNTNGGLVNTPGATVVVPDCVAIVTGGAP